MIYYGSPNLSYLNPELSQNCYMVGSPTFLITKDLSFIELCHLQLKSNL